MQSCHESISSSILMYLTLRRATCHVSTVAAGQCRRTLQAAAGHYKVMFLRRLVTVIDVLRHSCCQVDWQLTELNYTYSKLKIPTILLEIVSCGGLWRPAVIGRTGVAFVCRLSSSVWNVLAKRRVLEQKLLLTVTYMRNRLAPQWMTLTFV